MITFFKKKILVIDDDNTIRGLLKQNMLSIENSQVEDVGSLEEAVERISEESFHLIITDFHLNPGTAIDLLQEIRKNNNTVPVIVITGAGDTEKQRSLKAGATAYISKPYDYLELVYTSKNLIKLYEAKESLESAENIIEALARTVDAKDAYTDGHSKRVAEIALAIYDRLGLSDEQERKNLYAGCILHDIGKIAIPDEILKSTKYPLSKEDFEVIKTHPVAGYDIVKDLSNLQDAIPIIRHHHEKLDGAGYPDGLTEKDLSILIQISTVSDIYDALTSDRSYRKSNTPSEALEIMKKEGEKKKISAYLVSTLELILKERENF